MAYWGNIYYEFRDFQDRRYLVEFFDTEGSVESFEIKNAPPEPISINRVGGNKDSWDDSVILAQQMTFRFYVDYNDLQVIDPILCSPYRQWGAKVTLLDPIELQIFRGYLKTENCIRRYDPEPRNAVKVELCAVDGLAELKDVDFKNYIPSGEQDYPGITSLLRAVKAAVTPLGYQLPFLIKLGTYEHNYMAASDCALEKVYCNLSRFYKGTKGDIYTKDVEFISCYDVIEYVLKPFNCKLFVTPEYFCIVNFYEKNGGYHFRYGWDLILDETQGPYAPETAVKDVSGYFFKTEAELQKVQPLRSILVEVNNNDEGETPQDLGDDGAWTYTGWSSHSSDDGVLELKMTDMGQPYMILNTPLDLIVHPGNEVLRVQFSYRLTSYVEDKKSESQLQMVVRMQKPTGVWTDVVRSAENAYPKDTWQRFDSYVSNLFFLRGDGEYNVLIGLDSKTGGKHFKSLTLEIKDIKLSQYNVTTGYSFDPLFREVGRQFYQTNGDWHSFEDVKTSLYLFDAEVISDDGALLVIDGGQIKTTSQWNPYGADFRISIVDLFSRNILVNRSIYKDYIRMNIVDRNYNIINEALLKISNCFFVQNSYDRTYQLMFVELELTEIISGSDTYHPYDQVNGGTRKTYADYSPIVEVTGEDKLPTFQPKYIEETKDIFNIGFEEEVHGFNIGDVIRAEYDEFGVLKYAKAKADTKENAKVLGIVTEVVDEYEFKYAAIGKYIGRKLLEENIGNGTFEILEGSFYYLSATEEGRITDKPTFEETGVEVIVGVGTDLGLKVANIPKEVDIAAASSVGIPIYLHWENSDIQDSDSYTEESLESSDSSGYEFYPSDYDKALLELPSDIDCVYGVTLKESSGEILIKKFVTDPGVPNTTFLAAGIWFFQTYIRCSTVIGLSIKIYVYKRDEFGVETELFSFTQKLDDDSEIPKSYKYAFVGDNYILKKTDRLVFEYCAINSKEIFQSIELFVESITPTNIRVPFSIDLLATEIGGLTEIVTDMSVQGIGEQSDPITLVNDEDTPGISKYYGTDGTGEKGFYDLPEGGGGIDDVYVEPDPVFPIDYLYKEVDSVQTLITDIPKADGVMAGGHVSWLGGLSYQLDPSAYYKAGDLYTIDTATLTLDAADATHPRIDVLVVNVAGEFTFVKGTPAVNPQKPTINPLTEIDLGAEVYVAAGATEPTPVPTNEIIYNENIEWTATGSGVVINADSTAQHYQGSKSIDVGSIGNFDYIQFEAGSGDTFNTADWENIVANLMLKATLDTRKARLAVVFLLNDVAINNPTDFTIDGTKALAWQNLLLPFSRIVFFGEEFNQIRFYFYKSTGGDITGFYLDYIKLEIGIEQPPVVNTSVQLIGDVLANGYTGTPITTNLKVVNANIGTYGDGLHVARITVDAKGRVTAVSEVVITPGMSEVETAGSVVGVGDASDPVTLDGDEDSPGASMYYGTDGTGEKGFYDLPEGGGDDNYVDGATFDEGTRDLTLTRTGDLEDITVNIPCCDPAEVIQGAVTNIEYGALYNWWAANDARNIAPAGWHIPTDAEYVILREYLDPLGDHIENIAGTKLKETGLTHWQTGGGTNDVGFNARGSGVRNPQGICTGLTTGIYLWNSTPYPYNQVNGYHGLIYDETTWFRIGLWSTSKKSGSSIRLIKDNQTDTGTMTGNDGKVYPTVTIGTQVWMAANLAETKYRNGDLISNHGETYTDKYTDAEWAALTTEAMCWYDDNIDNGYTPVAVLQHNSLGGLQGGSTLERYHHTKAEADTHVFEAPEDGKLYARKDGAWEEVVAGEGTGTNIEINSAGDLVLNPGESNEETYTPPCTCDPLDMIEGSTTNVKYGYLYNWWAATDERNIAPAGWHVPTIYEFQTLADAIGANGIYDSANTIGGKLKEIGFTYWNSPNTDATNEVYFNARGTGARATNGVYSNLKHTGSFWTTTNFFGYGVQAGLFSDDNSFQCPLNGLSKYLGYSLRLLKDDTTDTGTMVGNDGKVYPTVTIGTQVWMAANLAETRYRNGDLISGPTFTNAAWAALTTEAYCIYDDNPENAGVDKITLRHNLLAEIQGGTLTERYHHTEDEYNTHVYEAPIDGDAYVRKNGDWEIMPESSGGSIIEKISFEYKDIETGVSQTYWLDDIAKYGYTILGAILCSDTTMDAVEIQINGTPVIFGSNSYIDVTTSSADTEATDDNVVVEDDVVTLVTSGTDGGAEYLRGSIYYQRT